MELLRWPGEGVLTIAVDPGLTTGLAVFHWPTLQVASDQIEGRFDLYEGLNDIISRGWPFEMVCERFTINAGSGVKSAQYDALYIIGHLEAVCHQLGVPFFLQTATQAKTFATDAKLKALGWYNASPGGHANDALRHLLRFMVTARLDRGGREILEALV